MYTLYTGMQRHDRIHCEVTRVSGRVGAAGWQGGRRSNRKESSTEARHDTLIHITDSCNTDGDTTLLALPAFQDHRF